jgi:polysaccharide biosynthesis/export protein
VPSAFILLTLLVAAVSGCSHSSPQYTGFPSSPANPARLTPAGLTNRIDPAWLTPPTQLFTLGPGDRLELEIMGEPASRSLTIVAPDGKVYFNLLPGVDVWGLTLSQAKEKLEKELAKYVRQQPQLSVVLRGVESKRIWMLGRITAPGVYALAQPMTLLEAISMAGGTLSPTAFRGQEAGDVGEELADLPRSFVLRHGERLPVDFQRLLIKGDLSQNIYLQPDDFVYFPGATAKEVYVLGAVNQPRPVPYRPGLTVAQAIASAYGTLNGAYLSHVTVVRGSLSNPEMATVDYKNAIRGEAPDLPLQPRDIVYVPFSPYRYLYRYVQLAIQTFVSSAAINAGTRAVGQTTVGGTGAAGVFIPVGSGIQITPPISPPPIH